MILGTVTAYTNNQGVKVRIDGESEATTKRYMWLSSYHPIVNDRVLIENVGDEYVILGKVTNDLASSALSWNEQNRISGRDEGYVALGIKGGFLYYGLAPFDGSSYTFTKVAKG